MLKEALDSVMTDDAYLKENVMTEIQPSWLPGVINADTLFEECHTKDLTVQLQLVTNYDIMQSESLRVFCSFECGLRTDPGYQGGHCAERDANLQGPAGRIDQRTT